MESKDNKVMTDPASLAAFMARIDERTMNISATMGRMESSLKDHQNDVDERFKNLMREVIAPMQAKIDKNTLDIAIYTAGGGFAGAGTMFLVMKAMQAWPG